MFPKQIYVRERERERERERREKEREIDVIENKHYSEYYLSLWHHATWFFALHGTRTTWHISTSIQQTHIFPYTLSV
jgi:hypothetical protein